jgi:di/tricarboxylate transporter
MHKSVVRMLLPLIQSSIQVFEENLPQYKKQIRQILKIHRRQMATDPNYPTMLLFVASILIKKFIHKQPQAATILFIIEQALRRAISRLDWGKDGFGGENDGYSDY